MLKLNHQTHLNNDYVLFFVYDNHLRIVFLNILYDFLVYLQLYFQIHPELKEMFRFS